MNLYEQFKDPHSRQVLETLNASIASFSENPLLGNLRGRKLSLDAFIFLSKARLNAATNFVPFLSAIQEKTERARGWNDVSQALRDNLDEERGQTEGGYDPAKGHDVWRQQYAEGLSRIWQESQRNDSMSAYEDIDVKEVVEKICTEYGETLMKLTEEDLPFLVGAFATLEGLLEQEFSAMLEYIRNQMIQLTQDELLYIAHHAGHEHRHMKEATVPLLKICQSKPDIVPSVIRGIEAMYALRHDYVLEVIRKEMELYRMRSMRSSK